MTKLMRQDYLQLIINQADIINRINEMWGCDDCAISRYIQPFKQLEYAALYSQIDFSGLKRAVVELAVEGELKKKLLILYDALTKNTRLYNEKKDLFDGFDVITLFSLYVDAKVGHRIETCKRDIKEVKGMAAEANDELNAQNLKYFQNELVKAQVATEEFERQEQGVFLKNYYQLIYQKVADIFNLYDLFMKGESSESTVAEDSLNLFNKSNVVGFVDLIKKNKLVLAEGPDHFCNALNSLTKDFEPNIDSKTVNAKRFGFLVKRIGEACLNEQFSEWQESIQRRLGLAKATFINPSLNSNDKNEKKGFWKDARAYLINNFDIDIGEPKFREGN